MVDLEKFSECISLLKEIFGEASLIMSWLEYPHPRLGNQKPRILIVDGQIDQVIDELKRIKNTDPS